MGQLIPSASSWNPHLLVPSPHCHIHTSEGGTKAREGIAGPKRPTSPNLYLANCFQEASESQLLNGLRTTCSMPTPLFPVVSPPWAFSCGTAEAPSHPATHSVTMVKRSLFSFSSSVRCEFAQDDSIYFPYVFFSMFVLPGEFLTFQCAALSCPC